MQRKEITLNKAKLVIKSGLSSFTHLAKMSGTFLNINVHKQQQTGTHNHLWSCWGHIPSQQSSLTASILRAGEKTPRLTAETSPLWYKVCSEPWTRRGGWQWPDSRTSLLTGWQLGLSPQSCGLLLRCNEIIFCTSSSPPPAVCSAGAQVRWLWSQHEWLELEFHFEPGKSEIKVGRQDQTEITTKCSTGVCDPRW